MKRSFYQPLVVGALLLVAACQSTSTKPPTLPVERVQWEHVKDHCTGDSCPLFNGDTLIYANHAPLNHAIEARLVELADPEARFSQIRTLKAVEQGFLKQAQPNWQNYVQAKERAYHNDVLVLELSSYLYTGGAHGQPGRGFMHYLPKEQRLVDFKDMLLPGQEARFWQLAEKAHRFWLHRNQLDIDTEYLTQWPFQQTPNVALLPEHVLLKYDVYAIAPYSSGHPELTIDYQALEGILDPRFLPNQ